MSTSPASTFIPAQRRSPVLNPSFSAKEKIVTASVLRALRGNSPMTAQQQVALAGLGESIVPGVKKMEAALLRNDRTSFTMASGEVEQAINTRSSDRASEADVAAIVTYVVGPEAAATLAGYADAGQAAPSRNQMSVTR